MKILIIEDETELLDSISSFLVSEGYVCEQASSFDTAMDKVSLYGYDIVVVDLNLPDGNGLDIIRTLKGSDFKGGIIIISARNALDDRITGLDIGADDYLIKPFHLPELNARIKSLARRILYKGTNVICLKEMTIDTEKREIIIKNELVDLTKKEFDLLLFLIINKDKALSKESIAEHLWGDYIDSTDSYDFVYAHIKNLRKKLAEKGAGDYLQNVYGVGYKFTDK
jgi:DNA-binding response OmpR family regulator